MLKRIFLVLVLIQLVELRVLAVELNFSRSHYPMLQGSTSDTVVHLNALVPRLKTFVFRARPVNSTGTVVDAEVKSVPQESTESVLHDKVIKVIFSGLSPNTEYEVDLVEKSSHGEEVVDKRSFKTFDLSNEKPLKVVTASCFCDEIKYEEVRNKIWEKAVKQNPDLFILMGDQTYVDSFDYVERKKATPLDVWMRYYRSFSENPLFRSSKLFPIFSTWDDHDTGIDNGNTTTPTLFEAKLAFLALYGSENIPGVVEKGKDGVQQVVSIRGQNFALLDNRSFRGVPNVSDRYGHFGEEQERWLIRLMESKVGPFFVVSGDMWGSPTILQRQLDGTDKRLTESVFGDHPANFKGIIAEMNRTRRPFVLLSGDIHFSQIIEHGPEWKGSPRENPFRTVEITSSPGHSIIFKPKPGEEVMWPDGQRIVGAKDYNFVTIDTALISGGLDIQVTSIGLPENPLFSFGTKVILKETETTNRRQILSRQFHTFGKKVKVAFFDADDTLRIAPSKSVSASSVTDVAILPGVAKKIAELTEQGYLIAIVSNQGGVRSGKVSFAVADGALQQTIKLIEGQNPKAKISYYDLAERGPADYYTKPLIGMADHLERLLKRDGLSVDWNGSFMVGDAGYNKNQVVPGSIRKMGTDFSDSDREFAKNLGIDYRHPRDFFSWSPEQESAIKARDVILFNQLSVGCLDPLANVAKAQKP